MILITKEKYITRVYGMFTSRHGLLRSQTTDGYRLEDYVQFDQMKEHRMRPYPPFLGWQITNEILITGGYNFAPDRLADDEDVNENHTLYELLLRWNRFAGQMTFEDWLRSIPTLRTSRNACCGLFRTDKGETLWVIFDGREFKIEQIELTSFIYRGIVTTLEQAMEKEMAAAQATVARLAETHQEMRDKTFMLAELSSLRETAKHLPTR